MSHADVEGKRSHFSAPSRFAAMPARWSPRQPGRLSMQIDCSAKQFDHSAL
jgi:hypothetical protein